RDWNGTRFRAYGYGWRLADIDGEWSVSHTGTLSGMYSVLHLLPDRRSGYVVLINGSGDRARTVINQVLVKHFTRPDESHTVERYANLLERQPVQDGTSMSKLDVSVRRPATGEELRHWLGTWRDPWFGEIRLCSEGDTVRFAAAKSPMLAGVVMESAGRYLVDWDHDSVDAEAWPRSAGHKSELQSR